MQQLIKRYDEIENCNFLLSQHNSNNKTSYSCKYLHSDGPIPTNFDVQSQYLMISNEKFNINCKGYNNNCCILKNDIYALKILNIVQKRNKEIFVIGNKLKYIKDELPCKSSDFGIKVMTIDSDNLFAWPITNVLCKTWKIPYSNDRNTFAIFPLNHAI